MQRTEALPGRTVALPISNVIAETLGLKPPKVKNLINKNADLKLVAKKESGKAD